MKKVFAIAAMVISTMVATNAACTANRSNATAKVTAVQNQNENIYGTWMSTVDHGTETVKVVISQNAMTITKTDRDGDTETKMFNSFKYNPSTKKIKAHQYQEVNVNGGFKRIEKDRENETYYVTWIDKNTIQLGDHPGDYEDDFGTLVRQ